MNVIITGGTGLLGQLLIRELGKLGGKTWVLTRHPAQAHGLPGVELVGWDARTPAGWGHLIEQADAILNLAGENIGETAWSNERKQRIRLSRLEAGQAVTEAVRQAQRKPAVLVQASAVGYYGSTGDQIDREETPPGDDFLAQLCVDWEASTREVETLGVRRVITRTGLVTDPQGTLMRRLAFPIRLYLGGPLGNGRQWFPWLHPADYTGAVAYLLENQNTSGPYNLAAPNPLRERDFGRLLAQALGRPYWLPVPALALQVVLGEMSQMVLDGQRATPDRLLAAGYRFRFSDAQAALQNLYR